MSSRFTATLRLPAATIGLPIVGTVAVVGLWWAAVAIYGIRSFLLPAPPAVAEAYTRLPGYLARHSWVTLAEVAQGFALAAGLGITAGVVLASSPTVERALYPSLVAGHAIPKLALAPLLVVWLGFGTAPKIIMVVLVCAFPVVLATTTGLKHTPAELVELARSLDATWWQTFAKVRLPQALPQIFVGLKTAAPLAVIGAVVGELFGATAGLGYAIQSAGTDTPLVFAALLLLAAMSIALFYLIVATERLVAPWVRHTTA